MVEQELKGAEGEEQHGARVQARVHRVANPQRHLQREEAIDAVALGLLT